MRMGNNEIIQVFKEHEKQIQSILMQGITLSLIEDKLADVLFNKEIRVNVCNDLNLVYFRMNDELYVYSKNNLIEGFCYEIMHKYTYENIDILTWGALRKFVINDSLKSRLNLPRILLINLHIIQKYPSYRFALGIADIAGYLRKYNLAKVDILDMQFTDYSEIQKKIVKTKYEFIGLSANFGHWELLNKIIRYINHVSVDTKIIVGNYLAATEYENLLKTNNNILVCSNEGELTFAKLCLNHLNEKGTLDDVPNLYYYNNDKVYFTNLDQIKMDDLPIPAMDTVEMLFANEGVMTLEFSRGCNYGHCSFCPRKFKGSKWRGMSNKKMFELWQYYYRLFAKYRKYPYIYFADEEFFGNCQDEEIYNRTYDFFTQIEYTKMQMNFDVSCRVDQMVNKNRDLSWTKQQINLFTLAKRNGLKRIFLGLESGSSEQLKRYNKGINISQAIASLRLLSSMGFKLRIGFITFDPLMTKDDLAENINTLARNDIILPPSSMQMELISNILEDKINISETNTYLYETVSYLASPLELLRDCTYINYIKANYPYLIEDSKHTDNFGRFYCQYLDTDIQEICDYCQQWVNYNFPLIYTLKGFSKRHDKNEEKYIKLILTYRKVTFYLFSFLCAIKGVIDKNTLKNIMEYDFEYKISDFESAILFFELWFKKTVDKEITKLSKNGDAENILFYNYDRWKNNSALSAPIIRKL